GKLPYGRGISVALAGPPGTGKTMLAQILAHHLGYELYRIDLSQVVNKYIGETEKNLGRIFDEARDTHAILFFDEADSLFAKLTEVRTSVDRYANLEVNYLLQRMESHDGIAILATNLKQGIDPAFRRRIRFWIDVDLPDAETRARLWSSMFPERTPLSGDIDWTSLGREFALSGGQIKKAAVRGALAALVRGTSSPVTHQDLSRAARLEYEELGRLAGA